MPSTPPQIKIGWNCQTSLSKKGSETQQFCKIQYPHLSEILKFKNKKLLELKIELIHVAGSYSLCVFSTFYLFKKYFTSTCTHLLLLESVFLCFLDETQKVIGFACVNCYSCLERSDLLHRTSRSHMCVCLCCVCVQEMVLAWLMVLCISLKDHVPNELY